MNPRYIAVITILAVGFGIQIALLVHWGKLP